MANPTKKNPHWQYDMELIKEISRTSHMYNSTPEEFAQICLYEQMAIRAKELRIQVRKYYVKLGIYFDLKALAHTMNVEVQGDLEHVFDHCIAISVLQNDVKSGKSEEKLYLESVYFFLLKLKSIDEGLYNNIIGKIDKKTKKWRIFQDYTHSGAQQLLK